MMLTLDNIRIPYATSLIKGIVKDAPLSDFLKVEVHTTCLEDSNRFLLSFCNQLDLRLKPIREGVDYAPWYYSPHKLKLTDGWMCVNIGKVETKYGVFVVVYLSKTRKTIDQICFYSSHNAHIQYCDELTELVRESLLQRNNLQWFYYQCEIKLPIKNLYLYPYCGTNFQIVYTKNRQCLLQYRLRALTLAEADLQARIRISHFTAFMSLETNMLCGLGEIEIISESQFICEKDEPLYADDYIDDYSVMNDSNVCISSYGSQFLDQHIFTNDGETTNEHAKYLLSGAQNIYEALRLESNIEHAFDVTTATSHIVCSPKDHPHKNEIITMAMVHYMSALESVTIPSCEPSKCPSCGSMLYSISQRIFDVVSKYLDEDMGKILKEVYGFRSRYLHAGKQPMAHYYKRNLPQIDVSTASNLLDTGFFTIKDAEGSRLIAINNIREWTTYVLRCYYQDLIFGRKDFKTFPFPDKYSSLPFPVTQGGVRRIWALEHHPDIIVEDLYLL